MSLRLFGTLSQKDAGLLNALQLAYIGDSAWETLVRDALVHRGLTVRHLHGACVSLVNAGAQAGFLRQIGDLLDETEAEIVRRGRNAHARHPAPRNQNPEDYAAATGFEALVGYLYLTGQDARLREIAEIIIGGD